MALLLGSLGLMVAVPLLAVVPIRMLYVEGVVGEAAEDEGRLPPPRGGDHAPGEPGPAAARSA